MKKIFILLSFSPCFCFAQTVNVLNQSGSTVAPIGNVVYFSKAGIISNASVNLYDSSFGTDQTTAMQNILNTASATNPLTVYIDVKASCTGLRVKSNTIINILPACGLILRDHSDNWLISNYNWTANSNAIVDSNITINGGILNGNGWRNGVNLQANNTHAKGQITVINFFGVKNVNLINTTFLNASSWCILFATSQNTYINNCVINDGVGQYIQDGIDFLGLANVVTVTNCTISNGDDKIVFCPNSTGGTVTYGGGVSIDHSVYTGVDGDQTNIHVSNIVFTGTGKGFAFYIQGGNQVRDVYISNISGTCQSLWLDMENYLPGYTITSGSQIAHNIHISNVDVQVASYVGYGANPSPNISIGVSIDRLDLKNITRTDWSQNAETININTQTSSPRYVTIGNLTIDGYLSTYPSGAGNIASHIILGNATVTTFNLINSAIDFYGYAYSINRPFLSTSSSSVINNLFMSNDRINNFKNVLINGGTIGNLLASNISHTSVAPSADTSFYNTGTISRGVFANVLCHQLISGTITAIDSTNILH